MNETPELVVARAFEGPPPELDLFQGWSHMRLHPQEAPVFPLILASAPTMTTCGNVFIESTEEKYHSLIMFCSIPAEDLSRGTVHPDFIQIIRASYKFPVREFAVDVAVDAIHGRMFKPMGINERRFIHLTGGSATGKLFSRANVGKILELTKMCSVHLVDCCGAGEIARVYNEFVEREKCDVFAFFRCGCDEMMTSVYDIPLDIFSMCVTSPAKAALFCHSRRYMAINADAFAPLSLEEVNNVNQDILDMVRMELRGVVEAMMVGEVGQGLSLETFLNVFRADETVRDCAIGFILACRIMSDFGVVPISIPKLPFVATHEVWPVFDLRLDAALHRVHGSTVIPDLLVHNIESVKSLMTYNLHVSAYLPQLAFLPVACMSCDDQKVGDWIKVLSSFMDRGRECVVSCVMLDVLPALTGVLKRGVATPCLFSVLARIMLCTGSAKEAFCRDLGREGVERYLIPHIESDAWSLILMCVLIDNNAEAKRMIVSCEMNIENCLKHETADIRTWALILVSLFVCNVADDDVFSGLLLLVLKMANDVWPETRIAAVVCLESFVGRSIELDKRILEECLRMEYDLHPIVRFELVVILSILFEKSAKAHNDQEMTNTILSTSSRLTMDPFNLVNTIARNFNRVGSWKYKLDACQVSFAGACFFDKIFRPYTVLTEKTKQETTTEQPITTRRGSARSGLRLRKTMQWKSDVAIQSNFVFGSDDEILFGGDIGEVHALSWNKTQPSYVFGTDGNRIMHLQFLPNKGNNLLLASNTAGDLFSLMKRGSSWNIINGFKIVNDIQTKHVLFECAYESQKLFSYVRGETPVRVFDLECERFMGTISPRQGTTSTVRSLEYLNNVIAVCGTATELYDTRVSNLECVLAVTVKMPVFDGDSTGPAPYIFSLCLEDGSVCYLDWRTIGGSLKYMRTPSNASLVPLSFATSRMSFQSVVGHKSGVTLYDIVNDGGGVDVADCKGSPGLNVCFRPNHMGLVVSHSVHDVVAVMEL